MSDVIFATHGPVAVMTLHRPQVLNALRPESLLEIDAALDSIAADPTVRVLVITGAGRAFCAGEDLTDLETRITSSEAAFSAADIERYQHLTRRLQALAQVTIAAINGPAVGLGAELALACDLRIASETARLGFVEAKRALFETNGATYLLPRLIGLGPALDLMISGEVITAAHAHRLGLVTRLYAASEFNERVSAFADSIAQNAPLTVRALKRVLQSTYDHTLERAMELEVEAALMCIASQDAKEGTAAFMDGRPPRYQGM